MSGLTTPRGLSAAGKRAWREGIATLVALGEEPELSAGTLERYAKACAQLAELECAWESEGSPATVLGGTTGLTAVAHPLVEQLRRSRAAAQQLATTLGLDPAGRRALSRSVGGGRPQGAASARDRAAPTRRRGLRTVA